MMKKLLLLALAAPLVFGVVPVWASAPTTEEYGDITLAGGFEASHFPEFWDLTAGDLVLSFTYDANGLVDDYGAHAHAWAGLGVRSSCYGDLIPTWLLEGSGVWLATDYDRAANTFDPDPPDAPTQDLDDKLTLQKAGGCGERYCLDGSEGGYDLPAPPPDSGANHGIWFDRDGVGPQQDDDPDTPPPSGSAVPWGSHDGVTYNTGGRYSVVITLHATSAIIGEAYMTVNGQDQGFYGPDWDGGPPDLYPAGMTFSGDMKHLRVFYGLYGDCAIHTVVFEDITVQGHFAITPPPQPWPCYSEPQINIDIQPGSDSNAIDLNEEKALVAVALLGSDSFDVTTVVPNTVLFAGGSPAHDLTDPTVYADHLEDVNGDEWMDLVFHFDTEDLQFYSGSTKARLVAMTHGGLALWGEDDVNVVSGASNRGLLGLPSSGMPEG
jgi:hypothetical protein